MLKSYSALSLQHHQIIGLRQRDYDAPQEQRKMKPIGKYSEQKRGALTLDANKPRGMKVDIKKIVYFTMVLHNMAHSVMFIMYNCIIYNRQLIITDLTFCLTKLSENIRAAPD